MKQQRCRAICTVNQVNRRQGAEYRCEEQAITTDPPLCWVHHKAHSNPNRTEPLRLVQDQDP